MLLLKISTWCKNEYDSVLKLFNPEYNSKLIFMHVFIII